MKSYWYDQRLAVLKDRIYAHAEEVNGEMKGFFGRKPKFILFFSISNRDERARVFTGVGNTIDSSWNQARQLSEKFLKEQQWEPHWIKVDIVKQIEEISSDRLIEYFAATRRNYMRQGISFDRHFNLAFLEQEINGNAFIKTDTEKQLSVWNVSNINHYVKKHRGMQYPLTLEGRNTFYLFATYSYFHDTDCYELLGGPLQNGRRKIAELDHALVYELIDQSSQYLANQVDDNGKFIYGYFACFNKNIKWYNMLRHASSVYSMIEAFSLTKHAYLGQQIQHAVQYLVDEGIQYIYKSGADPCAYVVEPTSGNEIKLGANAAAILALSKYTTVFDSPQYLDVMKALANGIVSMQDPDTGKFVHVLNPDLSVKEAFRIVYYDGEAAFALLRLYAIDRNETWLSTVEKAFELFIREEYWKYHDHWLSYSVNELVRYKPDAKYIEFGLKNVEKKLDFILNRDTTYPTFLELLMACYSMIDYARRGGLAEELLRHFEMDKLIEAIRVRAQHQLNGYFFPEVAMYFKSPQTILGAFYIRHHAFRSRIDDVEHNISGYYHFYRHFIHEDAADELLLAGERTR